mmetsp:Transcript_50543/g.145721  ORF Transcript_50543/g.145721 Transcript_50543/m.145721 type:complete len:278 (+) Transcript_50543:303-1136(+)
MPAMLPLQALTSSSYSFCNFFSVCCRWAINEWSSISRLVMNAKSTPSSRFRCVTPSISSSNTSPSSMQSSCSSANSDSRESNFCWASACTCNILLRMWSQSGFSCSWKPPVSYSSKSPAFLLCTTRLGDLGRGVALRLAAPAFRARTSSSRMRSASCCRVESDLMLASAASVRRLRRLVAMWRWSAEACGGASVPFRIRTARPENREPHVVSLKTKLMERTSSLADLSSRRCPCSSSLHHRRFSRRPSFSPGTLRSNMLSSCWVRKRSALASVACSL